MTTSTVTSKGQITIPIQIRHLLNINTGDVLEFIVEPDGKIQIFPQTKDVKDLKTLLSKPKKSLTIEQMNEIIAKKRGEK